MEHFDREFKNLLRNHNVEDLSAHSGVIYGVWADFCLSYLNPAWFRFAKENGGEPHISAEWGLGRSILDCISGEVRKFYEAKWNACLNAQEVWTHDYDCSSDMVYRRYHQIVYPMGRREGLLIVNSLIVERRHDKARMPPTGAAGQSFYLDENGFIHQCAHCRRVKNTREAERWDWVPEWVRRCPEHTSHTFGPTRFRHYYPMAATDGPA